MGRTPRKAPRGKGPRRPVRAAHVAEASTALALLRLVVEDKRAIEMSLRAVVSGIDDIRAVAMRRINGGAKPIDIDLEKVTHLARLGMKSASSIALCMGVNKETILSPAHRASVLDAMERGRALFEMDTLEQYNKAIQGGKTDKAVFALLIFKSKQMGWTDRQTVSTGQATQNVSGARERFIALVEKYKTSGTSEIGGAS